MSPAVRASTRRGCDFFEDGERIDLARRGWSRYKRIMNTNQTIQRGQARVRRPERLQIEMRTLSLDQMLPLEHQARNVWAYVDSLDLSPLYEKIQAVEGLPGRDHTDPRILLALWMFATIEGVSSARRLEKLTTRDSAYQWICGGVSVNYHMLSDFRTQHVEFLDELLTDTIATLLHQGLVSLDVLAQDGMRVRASAGTSSFRRGETLEKCRQEAQQRITEMQAERESQADAAESSPRQEAARQRGAEDRARRVDQALEELVKLQEQKEKRKKGDGKKARASTTDPEARNMKMADGGFRPAFNVQFATTGETRLIVSAGVTNQGSDRGQMTPMHEDIKRRYGEQAKNYLVDGGFATKDEITAMERDGVEVYAPIHGEDRMRKKGTDPHARQPTDTDEMFEFRQRMSTDEAKALYKERPSIAEFPNAVCRNHGLHQFRLRGQLKVLGEVLLHALTYNFGRQQSLGFI